MGPVEGDAGMDKRTLVRRLKKKCNDAEFIKRSQIAAAFGWEMAYIIIVDLVFLWMVFWVFIYEKPAK